jgi:hypothetical protein
MCFSGAFRASLCQFAWISGVIILGATVGCRGSALRASKPRPTVAVSAIPGFQELRRLPRPLPQQELHSIRDGMPLDEAMRRLGEPSDSGADPSTLRALSGGRDLPGSITDYMYVRYLFEGDEAIVLIAEQRHRKICQVWTLAGAVPTAY